MKLDRFFFGLLLFVVACCPKPLLQEPPTIPVKEGPRLGANRTFAAGGQFATDGLRLTLTSGTPVTTSDVTSAGTLYLTPYTSGQIATYDSSVWAIHSIAEISLALTLTSGKNYDVFVSGSTSALSLSAAWASDTARTDALATQDGVVILSADHSKRWVGSIRASGSNVTTDSKSLRGVYNAYNQVKRLLTNPTETQDSWAGVAAAYRQANGNAANQVQVLLGDVWPTVEGIAQMLGSGNAGVAATGIGIDSTTTNSAQYHGVNTVTGVAEQFHALYAGAPGLGFHTVAWLEYGTNVVTFYGDAASPTVYQTGLLVFVTM